ncbi:hypothetical protein CBP17_06925 [Fischerella thermalis WC114]|nr:hypothetical protein CBP17_06925 [Fischerella thermalis WC114]PLZ18898.1 hypothetical protein CBP30_15470 [Fischerella thermalis WC157]PLZ74537.1 hypothetical protein CBP22_01160 [Fischerella thermalis WC249]PLZ81481.1 hypothetical protein CBP20_08525 [Fischerella thermalis WC213]PMB12266.1 hypothetical protein CEN48_17900 [Fischerella thermalis CCMEE 5282]PMB31636.1 hypothetical protein CEN43_14075 [Fischerella thermalis BR2B]
MLKGKSLLLNARTLWATERSQGFKTPTKLKIWWLPFRRGLNPLLNGTFCHGAPCSPTGGEPAPPLPPK